MHFSQYVEMYEVLGVMFLQAEKEGLGDLFEDFKDGTKLLSLLEVLSGHCLVCIIYTRLHLV